MLGSALRPGRVVIMDNLPSHKGTRARELIEERGCEVLNLPPYTPDFNPVVEAFAKVKALLRRAAASSREALVEMIGAAPNAITVQDTQAFFEHCTANMGMCRPLGSTLSQPDYPALAPIMATRLLAKKTERSATAFGLVSLASVFRVTLSVGCTSYVIQNDPSASP
jgi:transposase